ncbi:myb-like protein V [Aricia agestis]|uniref:myb-like protein V n=1 Tax=Aricia agestis TaxID=91739 RepID=UPI001C202136|nr:myb-like protein V [Aricia agestis]
MEVGAVKQAFNNEVILLKKNLNQAKIQVIHKLTRKAKTFAEKKCPEKLKEKLKRKAESAVKEVLIIKKIKPRDLAKFIVTHKGKLNDYLNKPDVDSDKACARLLLHKALTNKYQIIKERFGNVSIKDLFMSRQERRQLKKEAREKQEKKKKKRTNSETDNTGGVWDVEVNKQGFSNGGKKDADDSLDDSGSEDKNVDEGQSDVEKVDESASEVEYAAESGSEAENGIESDEESVDNKEDSDQDSKKEEVNYAKRKLNSTYQPVPRKQEELESDESGSEQDDSDEEDLPKQNLVNNSKNNRVEIPITNKPDHIVKPQGKVKPQTTENKLNKLPIKNAEKRQKDNKNKNLNEKLKKRKFNKDFDDTEKQKTTIVDPFFITSTGDNYMSLVEPRAPDEVKEVHKEGNRKYRRAVMFGHIKPRRNDRPNKYNQKNDRNSSKDFRNIGNKSSKFDNKKSESVEASAPPEKLHPSWEAKKRQSTIVPFKGKKVVFDDT